MAIWGIVRQESSGRFFIEVDSLARATRWGTSFKIGQVVYIRQHHASYHEGWPKTGVYVEVHGRMSGATVLFAGEETWFWVGLTEPHDFRLWGNLIEG